jgi:hypothetical protein
VFLCFLRLDGKKRKVVQYDFEIYILVVPAVGDACEGFRATEYGAGNGNTSAEHSVHTPSENVPSEIASFSISIQRTEEYLSIASPGIFAVPI